MTSRKPPAGRTDDRDHQESGPRADPNRPGDHLRSTPNDLSAHAASFPARARIALALERRGSDARRRSRARQARPAGLRSHRSSRDSAGTGSDIDRQAILCPDVLPIDRTDSFTCSAWIKPSRAENLTIFSRMNSGLRGFDLNYTGTLLQAHLISSWDGNAIRVNTIERFDSSQWHHVAVTYDGSSRRAGSKIYLDGALATLQVTVDRLSETIRCDFPFAIGGRERRDYYQGRVDEVRAYNRS